LFDSPPPAIKASNLSATPRKKWI